MFKFTLTSNTKQGFSFKCLFRFVHFMKCGVVFLLPSCRGSVILGCKAVGMFQLLNE